MSNPRSWPVTCLSCCLVACLLLSACDNNRPAAQNEQRRQISQAFDEKSKGRFDKIQKGNSQQEESKRQETDVEKQEPNENDSAREPEDSQKQSSPLDEAARNFAKKEITDPTAKPEVPDAEVHEILKPLVQEHWVRMHPGYEVWLDTKEKQVIVGGRISVHDGMLEMFACPIDTKDHEAIISTISNAETIHIGLLAIGAMRGVPSYWTEETGLVTAIGPVCNISVSWPSEGETKSVDARTFIRDAQTGKALEHEWVFCGSRIWINPKDARQREYQADFGDLICVSNFPSAMIDLNVESSSSDADRVYVANPETVPSPGHPVLISIKPDLSTNPSEELVATKTAERDAVEQRMRIEMEKRFKEREARWEAEEKARQEQLQKEQEAKNKTSDIDTKTSPESGSEKSDDDG